MHTYARACVRTYARTQCCNPVGNGGAAMNLSYFKCDGGRLGGDIEQWPVQSNHRLALFEQLNMRTICVYTRTYSSTLSRTLSRTHSRTRTPTRTRTHALTRAHTRSLTHAHACASLHFDSRAHLPTHKGFDSSGQLRRELHILQSQGRGHRVQVW